MKNIKKPYYRSFVWMRAVTRPDSSGEGYTGWERIGAEGITFYWSDKSYQEFHDYVVGTIGVRPTSKHYLCRCNTFGNFEPGNLAWRAGKERAIKKGRQNLRISAFGETRCLSDWADQLSMNTWTLRRRIERGITVEDLLVGGNHV